MKKKFVTMLAAVVVAQLFSSQLVQAEEASILAPAAPPSYVPESPDYVIEPPDVIRVSMTKATTTTKSLKLVGPDGNIVIDGLGKVFLAGLTRTQAQQAILQHCKDQENEKQIAFKEVKVEIHQSNSKVVYLIHKNPRGDNVNRIPLNAPTTVRSMLKQAAWSHPVDFAASKIELRRPIGNRGQDEEIAMGDGHCWARRNR